ncbi:probable nucleoredoxin 1 [Daucus carota subsp. sativus]|uniref:probable nucleoredoxin 1 n=1 Tax=Daucus carota subsp. sativus TaxID=79200 RepID=UPI00308384FA
MKSCRFSTPDLRTDLMVMTRSLPNNCKADDSVKKHIEKPAKGKKKRNKGKKGNKPYRIGDTVNLKDLLFTQERDYLIKYKDVQIKKEQLVGKVIVLHFVSLVKGHDNLIPDPDLIDIYKKLEPKGGFEVVFVAVGDGLTCLDTRESTSTYSTPQQCFEEIFSTMPWTAIPFSDLKSRNRLEKLFCIVSDTRLEMEPISFVIDSRGVVLQADATQVFSMYGSAGYPFTKQRLKCLDHEDYVTMEQLSVSTLLASPQRDYVITNKGDQVPLHKLEDKVVALYFFTDISNVRITSKLKLAYKELCEKMEAFEVVLINLLSISSDTCEDTFWKTFEAMPWLAIPSKDTDCCKKLLRIFDSTICDPGPYPVSKLVIIGPRGKFIEPCGANILCCYGIPAYPFTRFSAVNLKIEKVKDVKPEMFWNLDAIFRQQNGSEVQFSQIVGKRIIVLFQLFNDIPEQTLKKLIALYNQMKGTDDEFEVIHIREESKWGHVGAVIPWLMHPPFSNASDAGKVMRRLFYYGENGLVAFDRDGRIVRMTRRLAVGKTVFPFFDAEKMEDEVLQDMQEDLYEPLETLLCCCW